MKANKDTFAEFSKHLRAYRLSIVIFTAYELGIFNQISEKPLAVNELSKELRISKQGLKRLTEVLIAAGILKIQDNKIKLTTEYEKLFNPNLESYIGGLIAHEIHLHKRWLRLPEAVRKGRPLKDTQKKTIPADRERFINAMTAIGRQTAPRVIDQLDLSGNEKILDLGGGPGEYLQVMCEKYPHINCTLLDQETTIEMARSRMRNKAYYKNISFLTGDLFEVEWGYNYDLIFISNVIHIFGPEEILNVLKKCRRALKPEGRLLIKDYYLHNDREGPEFSTLFSLHMFLSSEQGRCYSIAEIDNLLKKSGFSRNRVITITENTKIIEGIKKRLN